MDHPSSTSIAGPTPPRQRIVAIDVLRGFALLGILVINIRAFAMVWDSYMIPDVLGPLSFTDHLTWWLGQLLAEMKFMSLFSLLFGAGIVLMYERRDIAGLPSAGVHYRRMAGLLAMGVVHAYAIWYGDILVAYALCGLWLFPLRKCGPILLIILGAVLLLIGGGINFALGALIFLSPEAVAQVEASIQPDPATIAWEIEAYRGNWFRQMPHRALTALIFQTLIFLFVTLWRAGGLMLIGMGLIKLDVLTGKAPRSVYYALVAVGLFVGLPLIAGGLIHFPVSKRDSAEFLFFGVLYNYFGSIALTLGYVGLIMLLCQSRLIGWLHPLAAVGRTALTNYIGQSVICTLVFYGTINPYPLFGRLSWTAQMGVVVAIWVLQLVVATIWLRHFRMGPLEAAWRWSTYGKRSRMHNTAPQPAAPDGAENDEEMPPAALDD